MSFASEIENVASGEPIEAIVIGEKGWGSFGMESESEFSRQGEVLAWDEVKSFLDYTYDSGYGAPDCHAIQAWTTSYVIFVAEYDGSTHVTRLDRNPTPGAPRMI